MTAAKPTNTVYCGIDAEVWCDTCGSHCAQVMGVFHLAASGVTDQGRWLLCRHCGDWRKL